MVSLPSHLFHNDPFIGKTGSLYWIGPYVSHEKRAHFMCHHELWPPTSVSYPFSFLNRSLGLAGKQYQAITIPYFRLVLQNVALSCCVPLYSVLFYYFFTFSRLICYCSISYIFMSPKINSVWPGFENLFTLPVIQFCCPYKKKHLSCAVTWWSLFDVARNLAL